MFVKILGLNIINWVKQLYFSYFPKEEIVEEHIIVDKIVPVFSPIFNQVVRKERTNVNE